MNLRPSFFGTRLSPSWSRSARRALPLAVWGAAIMGAALPAAAQTVLLEEEFNDTSFDPKGQWEVYDTSRFLQRTQFGNTPTMVNEGGVRFARFAIDTYNPSPNWGGSLLKGTEVFTRNKFKQGTGVEFEFRMRGSQLRRGLVMGAFTYSERGVWPDGYLKEEIDFEFLTNFSRNSFWSNIWNDWNERYGYGASQHVADGIVSVSGMDYGAWNTYTLRWYPHKTEWLVNGRLVRTTTSVLPDDPMALRLNIWAAASSWGTAYDAGLQPTSNPASNASSFMDVDYVRVKRLAAPATGKWGTGDGLSVSYWKNTALTGTPTVNRVESTVNHNWKTFSPDVALPADKFSARWTGQVQAPYTGTFKFFVKADDGLRLWVNNRQIINAWKTGGVTEYSGSISLTAGVKVPIRLEYFENTGGASVQMSWSSSAQAKTVVPQSQLYSGDNALPAVAITYPTPNAGVARQITALGTASDVGGAGWGRQLEFVRLRLRRTSDGTYWNGSNWTANSFELLANGTDNWRLNLPALAAGSYSLQAVAVDMAGNSTSTSAVPFSVDATPPTVAITAPVKGYSYVSLGEVRVNAVDSGAGVEQVSLTLQRLSDNLYYNGSNWSGTAVQLPATSQGSNVWRLATPTLAQGRYVLTSTATDKNGNSATVTNHDFWVDVTAPSITVTSPAPNASYPSLSQASGTAKDVGPGVGAVKVRLLRNADARWWNGTSWTSSFAEIDATLSAPANGITWRVNLPALTAGSYTLRARAQDFVGNNQDSAAVPFQVSGAQSGSQMGADILPNPSGSNPVF